MEAEQEYDGSRPVTPKTPTASAWWALMDEAPFDETKPAIPPPSPLSPGERTRSQWSEGFWNLLLAESPSDELEAASCAVQNPHQFDRGASIGSKNQTTHYLKNELKRKTQKEANKQDSSKDSMNSGLLLDMLQCGNLSTVGVASFSQIEATIAERFEEVKGQCKLLSKRTSSIFDEYDDDIYEIHTDSVESFGIHYIGPVPEGSEDDIFIELQDEIPFLRERGEVQNASSKYKDILGATISCDTADRERKNRRSDIVVTAADEEYPLTSRKFPVENTIDQLSSSHRERAPPTSTPTNGHLLKGNVSPSRRLNEPPVKSFKHEVTVADTESLTRSTTAAPQPDAALPPKKASIDARDIPVDVGSEVVDEIIKKISTLTSEGDFGLPYTNNGLPDVSSTFRPNLDETKMCVPPMLMRTMTLKHLKLSKSLSSSQSVRTAAVRALTKYSTTDASTITGDGYIYDYDSNTHAYIAYFRRGSKAIDAIRLYEQPIPVTFATLQHEVVVRIEVSTVSGTDVQVRRGDFWGENGPHPLNLPIVPGVSFSGIVSQISHSAHKTGLSIGDRVISLVQVGANSRHLCVNSKYLVKVPDEIKDAHAVSCLPETYLTAFQALHLGQKNGARYRKTSLAGKCILVLGGGSTLGQALIQVAVAAGCETVYATEKEKHFEAISKAGGAPLGRDHKQWCSVLHQKVNIIVGIDNSVGKSELTQEHVDLLARHGRVILLCRPGLNNKSGINLDKQPEVSKSGRVLYRYNVFDCWEGDLKQGKRDLTHLLKLYTEGALRPKIIERIPLIRVAKAQDLMEGKKLSGFILCDPWIRSKKKSNALEHGVYAESASKSTSDVDAVTANEERKSNEASNDVLRSSATLDSPTKRPYKLADLLSKPASESAVKAPDQRNIMHESTATDIIRSQPLPNHRTHDNMGRTRDIIPNIPNSVTSQEMEI